ncbi:hypothetical protein [Neisseria shayeganii]|uniref:VCBS repeat-containing protein n=1 Tax=Neisseria shayeganii TaxID=607712 RepID=A0A7D7S4J4_9NEIS|nr:hypothetical protein [Neisseria shayeganii]QMT40026.1 hypothetical protein H3L94_09230 [Neisseria shayeganii]
MKRPLMLAMLLPILSVPAQAADFSALVPQGWKLDYSAEGDLNGDGQADAVIVVRGQDPAKMVRNEGLGASELDTNPRQLLVFLRQGQGYQLAAANRDWLPPAGSTETPCLQDPLEEGGIGIKNGRLTVMLHYWLSCGSWGVQNNTYTFRLEGRRFRLIGLDQVSYMRNSGEKTMVSTNYLSGRQKTVTGANMFEDEPNRHRERWRNLANRTRWYLDGPLPNGDEQ